jgi:phage terminase large subunit-like protein
LTIESLILSAHAFSTLSMVGLIWFVQVVHYPLFAAVPAEAFGAYEASHQRRTTWVVAPLMLTELVTSAALAGGFVPGVPKALAYAGLGMVAAVWGVTFLVSVPLHAKLERGKDEAVIRRLVATNWSRTLLWTARGVLAVVMHSVA